VPRYREDQERERHAKRHGQGNRDD